MVLTEWWRTFNVHTLDTSSFSWTKKTTERFPSSSLSARLLRRTNVSKCTLRHQPHSLRSRAVLAEAGDHGCSLPAHCTEECETVVLLCSEISIICSLRRCRNLATCACTCQKISYHRCLTHSCLCDRRIEEDRRGAGTLRLPAGTF